MGHKNFEFPGLINQAGDQLPSQPPTMAEYVKYYAGLQPEQQRDQWLSGDYLLAFPSVAQYLLSPDGLASNPPETRAQFFGAAVQALGLYRHSKPGRLHVGQAPPPYIPAGTMSYNTVTHKRASTNDQRNLPNTVDNLFRVDFAGVVMLGFSLPDSDAAMQAFMGIFAQKEPGSRQSFEATLCMLLAKDSPASKWVKDNGLDAASGKDWDHEYATFVLNFPGNVIRPDRIQPNLPPPVITMPNSHTEYSETTMRVFLRYAVEYSQRLPMTPGRGAKLKYFFGCLRYMPGLMRNFDDQMSVLALIGAIDPPSDEDSSSKLTNAQEYLRNYRKSKPYFRWYDPAVKQLLS